MTQKKMNYVVKKVLGDNHSIVILDNYSYQILKDENIIIHVCGTRLISAHWQDIVSNGINVILQEKIKSALSEI